MNVVWAIVTLLQTVFFMPMTKMAFTGFICSDYSKGTNRPVESCWQSDHRSLVVCCSISVASLYGASLIFIRSLFMPLEKAKRRWTRLTFAQSSPVTSLVLLHVKLALSATIVFVESYSDSEHTANVVTSVVATVAIGCYIGVELWQLPYKSQRTCVWVIALLCSGLVSNCIGVVVALRGPTESSRDALPSLWALAIAVAPFVAFPMVKWRVLAAFTARWERAGANHCKRIELGDSFQEPMPAAMLQLIGSLCGKPIIQELSLKGGFLGSMLTRQICVAVASNAAHTSIHTLDLTLNALSDHQHGIDLLLFKSST